MAGVLESFAAQQLEELRLRGLLRVADDGRRRRAAEESARALGVEMVDASSNDYLGLGAGNVSRETGVQVGNAGAGASRLIHGTRPAHARLERALAEWVQLSETLLFASGYAANVGLLSALGGADAVFFSDRLNHASIIDGCRLSRGTIEVVPHLDLTALRAALGRHAAVDRRIVVTEACFSMDGDGPDLAGLRRLCDEQRAALVVDEAHSLGVFGSQGAGRCVEAGVVPDALVGTFGKAVGTQGAFVAGSAALRELLWNRARSFVFSTATSPLLAELTLLHVERVRQADDLRAALAANTAALRERLARLGVPVELALGAPIVPIVVGDNETATRTAELLEREGILAQAIRPPTVPAGAARIRLTVSAAWPRGAAERVAEAVARAVRKQA